MSFSCSSGLSQTEGAALKREARTKTRVWGLGFRVQGSGFVIQPQWVLVARSGLGFWVSGAVGRQGS